MLFKTQTIKQRGSMIKHILCTVSLILLFGGNTLGQAKKFGDVSNAELEMTVADIDSSANAIVLFDKGVASIDANLEVRFKRHVRIKILTDQGLDEGDISITYRDDDPDQKITGIKAEAYYLENGKIRTTKVGRRDRFRNEISDTWSEIKFTIPGLRKGSVFEYEYEMRSETPTDVPDWYFQKSIPVLWSEYIVKIPDWFNFLTYNRGYHPFEAQRVTPYSESSSVRYTNSYGRTVSGIADMKGKEYHYIMKNVPAIEDEDYLNARSDYLAQVKFQLSSYQFPGEGLVPVLDTWPKLIEAIHESKYFGSRLKSNKLFKSKVAEIIEGISEPKAQMIAIYEHVSEVMAWDESFGTYIDDDLDDIYERGTGSSSEINMILIQMLREANIDVEPVLISTKNHGSVIGLYPIQNQFNHTLAYVKLDGETILLDAKNDRRPYNVLPSSVLNGMGLLINEEAKVEWIPLTTGTLNTITDFLSLKVDEKGNGVGVLQSKKAGLPAYIYSLVFDEETNKKEDEDFDLKEVIKKQKFNNSNIRIDSLNVVTDEEDEFLFKVDFNIDFDSGKDIIYLEPMIVDAITENPFKKSERTYPIDFEYPISRKGTIQITIPDGWVVDELPVSTKHVLPESSGGAVRLIQAQGNIIMIRYEFAINKEKFMPDSYSNIKALFEHLVERNTEPIVIKKGTTSDE